MIRVENGKCVRELARKSLKADRTRNLAAIFAIALTALLFTAMFTIIFSINSSFQESNFRMAGGYGHGTFKGLTEEQFDELKVHPAIREYGLHRFLAGATDECFAKTSVEVHCYDANAAKWSYCVPSTGRLPAEGTNEAAADLTVLRALGCKPILGTEFTLTLRIDGKDTPETFTLSGWWEADPVAPAHIVVIPESRVDGVLHSMGCEAPYTLPDEAGKWRLEVMLRSSRHIAADMTGILADHGYQSTEPAQENYVQIGVNWGYTGSQLSATGDVRTAAVLILVTAVILLTGFLVIYNVFRISVSADIRFYGLLKTIGATGRQIRRIIRLHALTLSAVGIPAGLALGWGVGSLLVPSVMRIFEFGSVQVLSAHPAVFLGAALFALATVLISCARPGRIAAKVSPVEAVRYTEGQNSAGAKERPARAVTPLSMAWANLGRSRSKTAITILSLALSVVLLTVTVFFSSGFDMDKYLRDRAVCDFIVARNEYFRSGTPGTGTLPEPIVNMLRAHPGAADGGMMLYKDGAVYEFAPEEHIARFWEARYPTFASSFRSAEVTDDGSYLLGAMLYGAEPFLLDRVKVLEGDIAKLREPGGRYVAAVCLTDDYGEPVTDSVWTHAGDTVRFRFGEDFALFDPATGQPYTEGAEAAEIRWVRRPARYTDETYEVAAVVTVPYTLTARKFSGDAFLMNAGTFLSHSELADTGPMLYAFNAEEGSYETLERFLSQFTQGAGAEYDYESRLSYRRDFESFRGMFLLLGGVLSFVVGLVGIVNFVNAVITGITSRRREFAVLQAVGMTGQQLNTMLMWEGLFYAVSSALSAILLCAISEPLLSGALEKAFWFFSGHFTLTPAVLALPVFLLLGAAIPPLVYRSVSRKTIVERLREADG